MHRFLLVVRLLQAGVYVIHSFLPWVFWPYTFLGGGPFLFSVGSSGFPSFCCRVLAGFGCGCFTPLAATVILVCAALLCSQYPGFTCVLWCALVSPLSCSFLFTWFPWSHVLFPVFALFVLAVLLAVYLLSYFGVYACMTFVAALGSVHHALLIA